MTKNLKYNLATTNDLIDIFNLSNDPIVRSNSFNSAPISLENHKNWFYKKINDPHCTFYVIRDTQNQLVGQIRLDKIENTINEFLIGISIAKAYRGQKLGDKLLKTGSVKFLQQNKNSKIIAYIKQENIPSLKIFLKAGYMITEDPSKDNVDAYKLEYKETPNNEN